jgi:DNA-3-methyladenine glycosylase I
LVGGEPTQKGWQTMWQLPAKTGLSAEAIGKDLKKRGLGFAGPTIVYYVMRAVAMVNDHTADNFRYGEVAVMG